jgi:hypothetical protein
LMHFASKQFAFWHNFFAFWCILHLIFNQLSSLQCLHEDQTIWGGKELKTSR